VGLGVMVLDKCLTDGRRMAASLASSPRRNALDTRSTARRRLIFLGFAIGTGAFRLVCLSLIAIALLTTIAHRSKFDPG